MEQKPEQRAPIDVTKKDRFAGIKAYFQEKPSKQRLMIVGGIGVGVLLAGFMSVLLFGPKADDPNPEPDVVSNYVAPVITTSELTGVEVTPELAARPVTAVMIENSVDARPQSGLQEAGVVFEAIAEGGITRFLALFQEAKPTNIGPIRSARPYYVEWAAGFDAAYTHSGGSGQALALISTLGVKDLDHGKNSTYFDRVTSRYAPHNVFTSMDRLDKYRESLNYDKSEFTGFVRQDEEQNKPTTDAAEDTTKKATVLNFNISSPLYNSSYTYDAETKSYARKMANQPHKDETTGKQIAPKVVIALITSHGIHSNGIHSVYKTIGSGKAIIFQEGTVMNAQWKKSSQSAELVFVDGNDDPVELVTGQTWITAIQDERVTYTP